MIHQNIRCLTRSGLIPAIFIVLLVVVECFPPVLAGTGSTGTDTGFTASAGYSVPLLAGVLSSVTDDEPDAGLTGADEAGVSDLLSPSGTGDRAWHFDVDTTSFRPDEYIVTAGAVVEEATGTALFNVVERSSANVNRAPGGQATSFRPATPGYYITINPIGDRYIGEKFTITGRTNLPEGAEMLVNHPPTAAIFAQYRRSSSSALPEDPAHLALPAEMVNAGSR
jgi:hypothetical protein